MRWIVDNSFPARTFPPRIPWTSRSLMRLSTETGLIVDKPLFLKRLSIK